jgi:MFS transporter, DHA1 family, solute carrier family 18 (vesicular amine transporter), member 1/2
LRRATVVLLFGAIFGAELGWAGISPLLPSLQDRYALSDVGTGLIVSVASVGILLVSLPASALTNRLSVRTLTLWSLVALALGNLGVGFSHSYAPLLVSRMVYGLGLGTIWVTGTAWLHVAAGDAGPRALALTTSIVGAGSLIGPALTGSLAERYSLGAPFVVLGAFVTLLLIVLILLPSRTGRVVEPGPPLREMLHDARADVLMLSALVLTLAVSLMWMSAELLAPLRLAGDGFSAARIGLVFSCVSLVFVVTSAITSARAERYATIRLSAVWTAVFAACVLVAVVGASPGPTIAFLLAMGLTTGVLVALTYPLGVAGAAQGAFSVAVVGALINLVWAVSGLVGPTVGGAASQIVDDRVWFVGLAACGFGAAAWMWRRRSPRSVAPVEADQPISSG